MSDELLQVNAPYFPVTVLHRAVLWRVTLVPGPDHRHYGHAPMPSWQERCRLRNPGVD